MTATVADAGERALIERIRSKVPAAPDWVPVGIGDDAAVLAPDRNAFDVLTVDALVEGIHFERAFVPPAAIGHRALAANLSDLAAMGARARAALLSLALPGVLPLVDFDGIVDGLLRLAAQSGVALVGGNIARSPGPLVVDITALGSVQKRRVVRRAGARAGDVLYVSGAIGGAAAGLEWCRQNGMAAAAAIQPPETRNQESGARNQERSNLLNPDSRILTPDDAAMLPCAQRFLYPEPRLRLGWLLARNRAARACVDLSDGLADGVHQLAAASGVGAIVEGDRVPIAADVREWFARTGRDPLLSAVTGGEDYELLFAMPARRQRLLDAVARGAGRLPLSRIGVLTREPGVVLRLGGRDEPMPQGFTHFR